MTSTTHEGALAVLQVARSKTIREGHVIFLLKEFLEYTAFNTVNKMNRKYAATYSYSPTFEVVLRLVTSYISRSVMVVVWTVVL